MKWQYEISEHQITDKWSEKRKLEEITTFRTLLNEWGKNEWEMIGYESVPIVGGFTASIKGTSFSGRGPLAPNQPQHSHFDLAKLRTPKTRRITVEPASHQRGPFATYVRGPVIGV